jgi:TRAP-type C4-dicarboxylate transport system permease small subunit
LAVPLGHGHRPQGCLTLEGDHAPAGPVSFIDKAVFYLGAFGMLGLFGTVLYTVGARYVFDRPPLWSVDVPNLIFIWLVFGVVGLTTKLGPQIRVVFFVRKMPLAVSRAFEVAAHCAVLMMLAAFIIESQPIIELSSDEVMLSTGWPGSVFFYALPVGCVVIGYYQILALLRILRGR